MIAKVFIEETGNGHIEDEMKAVYDECLYRDIPVERFIGKQLIRHKIPLSKDTLVVGYVDTVLAALQQLGIPSPPTNDYPFVLESFFHRHIWKSTLRELRDRIIEEGTTVFAKPNGRKKRFTGQVFRNVGDIQNTNGASQKLAIWCSDVVDWVSEYRVFVTKSKIVGIRHYAGDSDISIDEKIINIAVDYFEKSGDATAGYAMDFGVLTDGTTALVEWNDGFSLGSYGLHKNLYTDLLIARWVELVESSS